MIQKINTNNSTLANLICAIVFILFTFVYLFYFQADILSMEQHILSGGTTHYNKTVGAILITVILYLLKIGISKLTRFYGPLHSLNYVPSLLVMGILTSGGQDFDINKLSAIKAIAVSSILIIYIIFAILYRQGKIFSDALSLSNNLWKNLLIMSVSFILTCSIGNTDKILHYRLRIERFLSMNDYEKALYVGKKSDVKDTNITMLRIYALSRTKQLGEKLFEYPIPKGGSEILLPNNYSQKCLLLSEDEIFKHLGKRKKGRSKSLEYLLYLENHGLALKSVTDYILCGFLLDKNIDGFVNTIKNKYNLTSPELPKHYKEALTLYTHLRVNPVLVFHNEIMDADYADFQNLEKKFTNKNERFSYIKDTYGETYWFYYFYQ